MGESERFWGKSLAVFNIIAGASSIAGLVVAWQAKLPRANLILTVVFVFSLILSLYVLLVPGTKIEENVRSKIERYHHPNRPEAIALQRGEIVLEGLEPKSVEFEIPFSTAPEIEFVNQPGNDVEAVLVSKTPYQFTARKASTSYSTHGLTYRWIAHGELLIREQ